MKVMFISKVCHEVNKAYCDAIGDSSHEHWESAPTWHRGSVVTGVIGRLQNEIQTLEDAHNAWIEHKKVNGWKYGPIKDADKKEHPAMVPWQDLPETQRMKSALCKAVVEAMNRDIDTIINEFSIYKKKLFEIESMVERWQLQCENHNTLESRRSLLLDCIDDLNSILEEK